MSRGELALAFLSGGLGFAIADFADRYLATYDPSATTAAPTNKFTIPAGSTTQAGTLANTLNIASPPSLLRIGVGIGITAVPAIGAYLVKNSMGRAALQGMMLGAGIKLFSTLWNAYVMGNLLKPAASDPKTLQASLGARLYPAEVTAAQNLAASPVPYTAPNPGLNAPPAQRPAASAAAQRPQQQRPAPRQQPQGRPQGMGDPGPFAVAQAPATPTPCPAGQVADSLTGQCSAPCPDGSTPAGGQCPPISQPTASTPAPAQPAQPAPPNGGWAKVNVPAPGSDCGLSDQHGPLPEYLGFISQS